MIYCLTWCMKYRMHGIWNDMLPKENPGKCSLLRRNDLAHSGREPDGFVSNTNNTFLSIINRKTQNTFLIGPDKNDRWHVSLPILMTIIIGRGGVNSFFTLKAHFTYNSSSKLARQCVSVLQLLFFVKCNHQIQEECLKLIIGSCVQFQWKKLLSNQEGCNAQNWNTFLMWKTRTLLDPIKVTIMWEQFSHSRLSELTSAGDQKLSFLCTLGKENFESRSFAKAMFFVPWNCMWII